LTKKLFLSRILRAKEIGGKIMNNLPIKAKTLKILAALTICSTLSLGAYMLSAKDVTLSIDDEIREVVTYAKTVEDFLSDENIVLKEGDYISVPLDSKIENNMKIIINRAKTYKVTIGAGQFEIKSTSNIVENILKDNAIELEEKDYTIPALNAKVSPGDEIKVIKVEEVMEEVEETIPYEKLVRQNNNMDIGQEKVAQQGQDGLKIKKVLKKYENGQLISEEVVEEKIVKQPVPQIIERGTKNVAKTSRGSFRYKKVLTMTATAYDLSYESTGKRPGDKYYGITASGTKVRVGVVAVDPKVIPLGTKLYVQSLDGRSDYGFCIAEDTGGAIKGNRIDLFFNSGEEAKKFGVRKVKVYILDN